MDTPGLTAGFGLDGPRVQNAHFEGVGRRAFHFPKRNSAYIPLDTVSILLYSRDMSNQPRNDMERVFGRPVARRALTAEHTAFLDGQSDGYEDGRMGEYQPLYLNPGEGRFPIEREISSAYADGYIAGWNAGLDAREACEL